MLDFYNDEEMHAFYMILSEGKGIDYLEYVLEHMTEAQQKRKLQELRRYRIETGRKNERK